jgi:hypothetical protein
VPPGGVTLALSLAVGLAGCAHGGPAARAEPPPQECQALAALGVGDEWPPHASTKKWGIDALLAFRRDVSLWRTRPALALAIKGTTSVRIPPNGSIDIVDEKVAAANPPQADVEREKALGLELLARVRRAGGELVIRGQPRLLGNGVAFGTAALRVCGRDFPVYVDLERDIDGALLSPDRRWLALVHVGARRYSGASVPLYLEGVELALVNLTSLSVQRVLLEDAVQDAGFQSVALGFGPKDTLRVRVKDVWNGASDKRREASCVLGTEPCKLTFREPAKGGGVPAPPARLEVTAKAAYMLEPAPSGYVPAPGGDLVLRSVRASPGGGWVAFVTRRYSRDLGEIHTLWLQPSSGGPAVRVTEAGRMPNARWSSADEIIFEGPVEPRPELERELRALMADPGVQETAKNLALEGEEELSEASPEEDIVRRSDSGALAQVGTESPTATVVPDPARVELIARALVEQQATRKLGAAGRTHWDLWRAPLYRYSLRTKQITSEGPGDWVRLWGSLGGPAYHHKGRTHEVAPD